MVEVPLLADSVSDADDLTSDDPDAGQASPELVVLESVERPATAEQPVGRAFPQSVFAPLPSEVAAISEPQSGRESGSAPVAEGGSLGGDDDEGFGGDRERTEAEMDMTPMVDVTFLLLIFFMVTASFSMQKAMQVPKPNDETPSTQKVQQEEDQDSVTVEIDEFNTFHVITSNDEFEAPSRQELLVRLRESRGKGAGTVVNKLIVRPHEESLHERVVMALDAGAIAGFSQVQLMKASEE